LDTLQKVEYQQAILKVNFSIIESKLNRSKEIQARIFNLENSEIFLTEKEIDDELKQSEELVQQVSRVSEEISALKKDKSYLNLRQIQSLQEQVNSCNF
jgi:hypothetical protein